MVQNVTCGNKFQTRCNLINLIVVDAICWSPTNSFLTIFIYGQEFSLSNDTKVAPFKKIKFDFTSHSGD
jgi:hypothetical protein